MVQIVCACWRIRTKPRLKMKVFPMSPWLFLVSAGFHLCLGVGIGWLARSYLSGTVAERSSEPREGSTENREPVEGHRLLESIGVAVDEHDRCIGAFKMSLHNCSDSSTNRELADRIHEAKKAGRQFEQAIEELTPHLEGLTARQRWQFGDLPTHLEAHCETSRQLHGLLEQCGGETSVVPEREMMLVVIAELVESKRSLESELVLVQQRLQDQNAKLTAAERAARHDVLTDLPNRRSFEERIVTLQADFRRHGEPYSCIMVDIDHFKGLNDSLGHAAGDTALAVLGRILREVVRTSDQPARYGGEEFAVLLPATRLEDAAVVAERCRTRITETTVRHQEYSFGFTVSAGVAEIQPGESNEDLLHRADAALYTAKHAGRNRVQTSLSQVEERAAQRKSEMAPVG